MLMGMLAAGGLELLTDGLRTADPDNPRGYYEYEPTRSLEQTVDSAWVATARGKGVKVISFLLPHLPNTCQYKIVFVRRDLREVLASQRKMLERRGEPPGDVADSQMAEMFAGHLVRVEAALTNRRNCDVLYVDYQAILRTPAALAEQINAFLGGRLDVARMAAVVEPALYRNRAE